MPLQSVPVFQATELILRLAERVRCVAAPALLQLGLKRWRTVEQHAALRLCGMSAAGQQLLPAVHAALCATSLEQAEEQSPDPVGQCQGGAAGDVQLSKQQCHCIRFVGVTTHDSANF